MKEEELYQMFKAEMEDEEAELLKEKWQKEDIPKNKNKYNNH
jgi:hypothetical protein